MNAKETNMTATRMQTVLTLMIPISVHVWKGTLVMGTHVRVKFPLLIKKMEALASLFPVFLLFFLACFRLLAKFLSSYLSLFSPFPPSFSLFFFISCFLWLHRFYSVDVYECIRNHSLLWRQKWKATKFYSILAISLSISVMTFALAFLSAVPQ